MLWCENEQELITPKETTSNCCLDCDNYRLKHEKKTSQKETENKEIAYTDAFGRDETHQLTWLVYIYTIKSIKR